MKKIIFCIALLTISSAFADQCQLVTKNQAKKALNLVLESNKVEGFCELCGEELPKLLVVNKVSVERAGFGDFWELKINDKISDLAYTYVNGHNLAEIVGCEVMGVSSSIK